MTTQDLKPGDLRITATGVPVQVVAVKTDVIILKSLKSDNKFSVSVDYTLRPLRKRRHPGQASEASAIRDPEKLVYELDPGDNPRRKPLSYLIDSLLLKGGLTMRGVARELRRKDSVSCKGKDVRANIRARLLCSEFPTPSYLPSEKVD